MTKISCISLLLLAVIVLPAQAQNNPVDRKTTTFSLTYGFLQQQDPVFGASSKGQIINAGLGFYLSQHNVLLLRGTVNEAKYIEYGRVRQEDRQTTGFLGISLQHWFNNRIYAEGGAGIGRAKTFSLLTFSDDIRHGFAALLGGGVNVYNTGFGFVKLGIENTLILLDDKYIYNAGFQIGYQFQ